jgi:hypothetical protein
MSFFETSIGYRYEYPFSYLLFDRAGASNGNNKNYVEDPDLRY